MSRRIPICRSGGRAAAFLLILLLVALTTPQTGEARDGFPGYPASVRALAERVVAAAGPGNEEALAKEVRLLRIRMHSLGILSINAIPDAIYERAVREGWKREAARSMSATREVSPFSVPLWAWLVKEDIRGLNLSPLLEDMEGLIGSLRQFGPALMGYAAYLISFLSAAGCWFVIWVSILLFLRARPSLEGDLARLLRVSADDYPAVILVVLLFLLPLLSGLGLAIVACIWMTLSAGYLRRGELVLMTVGLIVLTGLLLAGGGMQSLRVVGAAASGGWLGEEGNLATVFQTGNRTSGDLLPRETISWMERFAKARAEMQVGNAAAAEKLWTSLAQDGRGLAEILNNRGITRVQQGKIGMALADFEAAVEKWPTGGPALWNAYQAHLQVFNLERARRIQPEAWERIQKMAPYRFRPSDMEQGEWVASALPVGEIWKAIFQWREGWIRDVGESDFFRMFFHPLQVRWAVGFLLAVWLVSAIWKLLAGKLWIHATCRACGSRSLTVRSREISDICTPCRVKIGEGIRAGEERDRRVQTIVMHRWYVRGSSLLVPGSGTLWAGKEIGTLVYGVALSMVLGGVTSSLGGQRAGGVLVADLQSTVMVASTVLTCLLWLVGAWWGIRSFSLLQRRHNIAVERR